MMAGRSRARPVPTTIEINATVVGEALPLRRSSTICWRRVAGVCGSVSAVRSSSDPSKTRAKRNSSSSTSSSRPSARGDTRRARLHRRRTVVRHLLPAPDLVDVILDELHLRLAIEVLLHDGLGCSDGQAGHLGAQVGDRRYLRRFDVGRGLARNSAISLCGLRLQVGSQRVGGPACLFEHAVRLVAASASCAGSPRASCRHRPWPFRPHRDRHEPSRSEPPCPFAGPVQRTSSEHDRQHRKEMTPQMISFLAGRIGLGASWQSSTSPPSREMWTPFLGLRVTPRPRGSSPRAWHGSRRTQDSRREPDGASRR